MSSEGGPPVPDVSEAEFLGHVIRAAEIQTVASEDSAHAQDRSFHYTETHHSFVEVFRAGRAVDAVGTEKRRDQFLIAFDREEEYSSCNVSFHVIKIASGCTLCNPRV